MREPGHRTTKAVGREDAAVTKVSAHVHVAPELLDNPVAFADYVISELRRGDGMILLSIIREHQP